MTDSQKADLEKLKTIGVNEISSQTSIVKKYIVQVLNNDVENIYDVKLNGFLGIIEKEYEVDLSFMKKERVIEDESIAEKRIIDEKEKSKKAIYIGVFLLLLIVVYTFIHLLNSKSEVPDSKSQEVSMHNDENVVVEPDVTENTQPQDVIVPANTTTTATSTTTVTPTPAPTQAQVAPSTQPNPQDDGKSFGILTIKSDSGVWYGHVYLKSGKKENFTIRGEKNISIYDETYISVINRNTTYSFNGKPIDFGNSEKLIHIRFKNGSFEVISTAKYTEETKGKGWY